jgi:hypothetical protein
MLNKANLKAVQFPLTFIVFLIILVILVSVLIIWNFSGIKIFDTIFGSTGTIINGTSGGAVNTLLP